MVKSHHQNVPVGVPQKTAVGQDMQLHIRVFLFLGKTCTHALVFAQLVTEGTSQGVHAFLVPIRDPATLISYPGIKVGDVGEKVGLNAIDNG